MELILPILIILVCAKISGEIFARIRQPQIIGEMMAGVVLGPSLLKLMSPEMNGIDILAELGIFFLLFLGGMQINLASFREYSRHAIFIAIMGNNLAIAAGLAVGYIFGLDLMNTFFIAIVFSLTALPVGVQILMDLGKMDSTVGKIIITSAVLDDILSMFFFAIVLSIAEGNPQNLNAGSFSILVFKVLLFLFIIYCINKLLAMNNGLPINHIKSLIRKLTRESQFFVILLFGILIGFLGRWLEITFIIGIFYAGTIIKKSTVGEGVFTNVHNVVSSITSSFFSPILFAYLGLLLDLSVLFDPANPFSDRNIHQGIFLLTAIVFAMVGKGMGAFTGGVLANMNMKDALAVGIGLNARGLMGLMISGIGLKYGLIDMSVYAMLVTMCIITTFITPYGLKRVLS
ncbi:MAG: cation:proton antiporter [Euryarchaeota archaeon]|nr:cation:proton antiporter [Euryarchaeota archaeon]MBU4222790.1 cation:proton antiporter [Euryarchaeota archaeon]MBU4340001.1 cation:proton antiporter [Euryarchaeota archaeon]MBU4454582.1 cation:proton antiporter [Euryarchaeota archaeon]MCG2738532.1 cation:proton antiporter [Candidatus Methanoperedenaceae archaeon]